MKKNCPRGYFFDETKNRYFKVLPGHANSENAQFLTPEKVSILHTRQKAVGLNHLSSPSLLQSLHDRQVHGSRAQQTFHENYTISRLANLPQRNIRSRFRWHAVESIIIPPKQHEPIVISQTDLEVTIRFLKFQREPSPDLEFRKSCLKLVECYPSSKLYGDLIDPCVNTNPYRLIFAQTSGLDRVSSSIILHDIEHGYDETLSFGSREIWSCAWSKKLQQLAIGSRRTAYCLDPETRAVQSLNSNSLDVLAQSFGLAKSTVRNVVFNGCRNGHVIGNDLRAASKALTVVANEQYHRTSICSILSCPVNEYRLNVADRSGMLLAWDLRMSDKDPVGIFTSPEGLNSNSGSRYNLTLDGRFIFTVGTDRAVKIWCSVTFQLLAVVPLEVSSMMTKLKSAALLTNSKNNSDLVSTPALLLGSSDGMRLVQ